MHKSRARKLAEEAEQVRIKAEEVKEKWTAREENEGGA